MCTTKKNTRRIFVDCCNYKKKREANMIATFLCRLGLMWFINCFDSNEMSICSFLHENSMRTHVFVTKNLCMKANKSNNNNKNVERPAHEPKLRYNIAIFFCLLLPSMGNILGAHTCVCVILCSKCVQTAYIFFPPEEKNYMLTFYSHSMHILWP